MVYKMNGYGVEGKKDDPYYSIKAELEPKGYNPSSYGFFAGPAYSLPFAILLLVTGTLADFSNRTLMVTLSCLAWSVCVFGMGFVEDMDQLIALRVL